MTYVLPLALAYVALSGGWKTVMMLLSGATRSPRAADSELLNRIESGDINRARKFLKVAGNMPLSRLATPLLENANRKEALEMALHEVLALSASRRLRWKLSPNALPTLAFAAFVSVAVAGTTWAFILALVLTGTLVVRFLIVWSLVHQSQLDGTRLVAIRNALLERLSVANVSEPTPPSLLPHEDLLEWERALTTITAEANGDPGLEGSLYAERADRFGRISP